MRTKMSSIDSCFLFVLSFGSARSWQKAQNDAADQNDLFMSALLMVSDFWKTGLKGPDCQGRADSLHRHADLQNADVLTCRMLTCCHIREYPILLFLQVLLFCDFCFTVSAFSVACLFCSFSFPCSFNLSMISTFLKRLRLFRRAGAVLHGLFHSRCWAVRL